MNNLIPNTDHWHAWIDNSKCIDCGACVSECPVNAIVELDDNYYVLIDICIEYFHTCGGHCFEVCIPEAISPQLGT